MKTNQIQVYYNANIFYQNQLQLGGVLVEDGKIIAIETDTTKFRHIDEQIDLSGKYLIPGFIDTHIHGIGGYSFQNQSSQDVLEASQKLATYGVTSFIPTISRSSAQDDEIIGDIQAIVTANRYVHEGTPIYPISICRIIYIMYSKIVRYAIKLPISSNCAQRRSNNFERSQRRRYQFSCIIMLRSS